MILASFKLTLFRAISIQEWVEEEFIIWNFYFSTVLVYIKSCFTSRMLIHKWLLKKFYNYRQLCFMNILSSSEIPKNFRLTKSKKLRRLELSVCYPRMVKLWCITKFPVFPPILVSTTSPHNGYFVRKTKYC